MIQGPKTQRVFTASLISLCHFLFVFNVIYLFIGCAGSLLLLGLFSGCSEGGHSLVVVQASSCSGFSCCGAQALGLQGLGFSSGGSPGLEHRFSSCDARVQLLSAMQDFPRSVIEPLSPALAGGFFTTEPSEKPFLCHFIKQNMELSFTNSLGIAYLGEKSIT